MALVLAGLNVPKPLVVDDAAFHQVASQIAEHPLDPYGFEIDWYDRPLPANQVLAPPVLPAWWALGMALFGDEPVAWKLWLFPFALLLSISALVLGSRVAPDLAVPVLVLVLLSPALLPAFNLMLDVPALALGLASLALLVETSVRPRARGLAILAGGLAALAVQTKYTAVLPCAAGLLALALARRIGALLLAGGLAAALFLAWEAFTLHRYGQSHWVNAVFLVDAIGTGDAVQWSISFLCLLGAASAALIGVGVRTLSPSPVWGLLAAAAIVAVFAAIAALPPDEIASSAPVHPDPRDLDANAILLAGLGYGVCGVAVAVLARYLRPGLGAPAECGIDSWIDTWLLGWLAIELVGFAVLSPYPALRRIIGVHAALGFALARAAHRAGLPRGSLRWPALLGLCLGLLFAGSDLTDALARRRAAERAFHEMEQRAAGRPVELWYSGHWGFRYYATRAGLRPLLADRAHPAPHDLIVVADGVHRPALARPEGAVRWLANVQAVNPWPWSTLPAAYGGYRPIRPQPRVQLRLSLYEVESAFTVRNPRPGEARWP